MRFRLLLLAAILTAPIVAKPPAPTMDCWCEIEPTHIPDADTVHGNLWLPFGVVLVDQEFRLEGIDFHETSKRRRSEAAGIITDEEVELGKRDLVQFKELLKGGRLFTKQGLKPRDNYGRLLGPWKVVKESKVIDVREYGAANGWARKAVK